MLDTLREFLRSEPLRDDFHSRFQVPAADDGVFGVARDEQYLELAAHRPRRIPDLATVHPAGPACIGDEQSIRRFD